MKAAGAALNTHLQGDATTIAQFWKVRRTDGTLLHFASHDVDVSVDLIDGDGVGVYEAETSFKRTAISNNDELSVDNLDVEGLLRSDKIDETELRRGLFDFAEVWVFLLNYEELGDGIVRMRRGWFGEVTITPNGVFKTELRGMTQILARVRSDVYEAECPHDLGDPECGIPISPTSSIRETAYAVGDFVRQVTQTELTVLNPGAESGVANWTNEVGTLDDTDVNVTPHGGSAYFAGGNADAETKAFQDISIPGGELAGVDAGNRSVELSWFQQALAADNDPGQMTIRFLDGVSAQIGSEVLSSQSSPTGGWTERSLVTAIPALARTIRIAMRGVRVTGGGTDSYFDDVALGMFITTPLCSEYGSVMYQATTAGVSGASQPVFDTGIGNTTNDGTVVWTAEEAWSRSAIVSAVGADVRRNFTVTELTPATGGVIIGRDFFPDDSMNGGVVQWETGLNAGRSMEAKDFVADDGITITQDIQLFLQMPFDIQVGDQMCVYRGCPKSRDICRDIFENMKEFGGYPDVPGQGIFVYPDAKS